MGQEKEPDSLYHYCSTSAFHSIISKRAIRLSSLSLSNDSMEGRLVVDTCRELLLSSSIDQEVHPHIISSIQLCQRIFDSLGFCLSAEGDLLSQWRGYADNAQGFSIGFNSKYFDEICRASQEAHPSINLEQVGYTNEKHKEILNPLIEKIAEDFLRKKLVVPDKTTTGSSVNLADRFGDFISSVVELISNYFELYSMSFKLKGYGFHEEREWRLISHLAKHKYDIVDFRASSNCIIPFREVELEENHNPVIDKVYLGPKNTTPIHVVEGFLEANGFAGVEVLVSSATYR